MAVPISCNTVDFMNAETSNLRVPTITSTMDSGTERQLAFYPSGGYLCIHHNGGWGPANNFEFKVSGSGLNWDGTTLSLDSSAFLVRQYDSTAEYGQQYYYNFNKDVVRGMRIAKNTTDYIYEAGELYLDANNYLRMGDSTGNRAVEITETGFGLEKSQDGVLSLMLGTGLTFNEGGYHELCVDTSAFDNKYLSLSGGGMVSGTATFTGTVMFSGPSTTFTDTTAFTGTTTFTTKPTLEVGFSTYVGSEITLGDDSSVTLNGSTDSSRGGITLTGTANLNTASGVLTLPTGDNAAVHQTGMVYFTDHADSPTLQIYSAIQGKWVKVGGSSSGGGGDYLPLSGGTLTGDLTLDGSNLTVNSTKISILESVVDGSYSIDIGPKTELSNKSIGVIRIGRPATTTAYTDSSSCQWTVMIGEATPTTDNILYGYRAHVAIAGYIECYGMLRIPNYSGTPIIPAIPAQYKNYGQIYFNTADKKFYGYNGTAWKAFAFES